MDEIALYAALRPEDGSDLSVEAARQRLAREVGACRRPRPRRRHVLLAAATAAAAIVVAAAILPGRDGSPMVTAAWVVHHNANGTIKVTMKQARDAAGLQRALRADGITAYVRYVPWVSDPGGPVTAWPAENCSQEAVGRPVPGRVVEAVFPFPAGGGPEQGYALTIRRDAIPAGDAILIQVTWTQGRPDLGIDVQDSVMSTTAPPVCTANRG
jgi:hypothetical protein